MKKILLTRMKEDNVEDRCFFKRLGYEVAEVPLLEVRMKRPLTSFLEVFKQADWLFFTSRYAVKFCWNGLLEAGLSGQMSQKKIASIGKKTSETLRAYGMKTDFEASVPTKQVLFNEWIQQVRKPQLILYPTSQLADLSAVDFFAQTKHQFIQQVIYQNLFPLKNQALLVESLRDPNLLGVYFTAPSIWGRFKEIYETQCEDRQLQLICLGKTTKQVMELDGYRAILKNEFVKTD